MALAREATAEGLTLRFPAELPCEVAYGFRIEVDGELDDSPRETFDDGQERVGDWLVFSPQ